MMVPVPADQMLDVPPVTGAGVPAACCAAPSGAAAPSRSARGFCGGMTCAIVVMSCSCALADPIGVVELFTSQGCSSCPPADQVLENLARDPDVIALSFSVDVWDYLGWRDTLARPEFAKRQRGYARARGDGAVYTPQVVVNGREDFVGSNEAAIRSAVEDFAKSGSGLNVTVTAGIEGDRLVVNVPAGQLADGSRAALWIAGYRAPQTIEVAGGENGGRAVTYVNSVERWQVLGMWKGEAMHFDLPLSDIAEKNTAGVAVVLQTKLDGAPGPILGATKVDLLVN